MTDHRPRIQFLDDEPGVLDGLRRILRREQTHFAFTFSVSPFEVLEKARNGEVDVLVSDISMPELDGFSLLARIRETAAGRRLPVIFLTGRREFSAKRRALDLDATDLLNKPVAIEDLLARLRSALRLRAFESQLQDQNVLLEQRVRERTAALEHSRREIIWRLAKAAELHDTQTGDHVTRVGWYSYYLGTAMELPGDSMRELRLAAALHDVGKIGIPDGILRKSGALSDGERAQMECHCQIGAAILRDQPRMAALFSSGSSAACDGLDNTLLETAARIALSHHEHCDGGGYPDGLRGGHIPIEARIVAVADVFDALCSTRPYKPAYDVDLAAELVFEQSGAQFDPEVVRAFQRGLPKLHQVRAQFAERGLGAQPCLGAS